MTNDLLQFSPRKSETKNEDLRTPTLDLFEVGTLAEEIVKAPDDPGVKAAVKRIIEHCEYPDMADIRALAEQIKAASDPGAREDYANQIIGEITLKLAARNSELDQVEVASVAV